MISEIDAGFVQHITLGPTLNRSCWTVSDAVEAGEKWLRGHLARLWKSRHVAEEQASGWCYNPGSYRVSWIYHDGYWPTIELADAVTRLGRIAEDAAR